MATIRFEGRDAEVADGTEIVKTVEELGLPLGCQDGLCGTCMSTVVQGMENLEVRNEKEIDMDIPDNQRLACQCVIKSGLVELSVD